MRDCLLHYPIEGETTEVKGVGLHNVFKLPMHILENFVANSTANSSYGRYINSSSLIIIDEVYMCPLQVLNITDTLLRDPCDQNDKLKSYGGKKNTPAW